MTATQQTKLFITAWKEVAGQALVSIGVAGGALTIMAGWSNEIASAEWLRRVVADYSAVMTLFFGFVVSPFRITISNKDAMALSFLLFYTSLAVGALILESGTQSNVPRWHNLIRVFVVSYIIWPVIFLISFGLRILTISDTSFTLVIFLSVISLCYCFINTLIPINAEILGLLLLLFICNWHALDRIRDTIFGIDFGNGYKRGALEITLTLMIVMILFFPTVLASKDVFRKGLSILIISAAVVFGTSAASQLEISQFTFPHLISCCTIRLPVVEIP